MSYRNEIIAYAKQKHATLPEHLWRSIPGYVVLRHAKSRKWYGIIMDIPAEKLGLPGKEKIDVLEVKCDPIARRSLLDSEGLRPAYHMKQGSWICALLDGTVEKQLLFSLLDTSYKLTSQRGKQKNEAVGSQTWIVPVNPHYYDISKAFSENEQIIWKQSNNIAVGDTVFLYVTAPISAILYRCEATEVNIAYPYDDGNVHMNRVMRIKKVEEYAPSYLPLTRLRTYGVEAIRGPRRMPHKLIYDLKRDKHAR